MGKLWVPGFSYSQLLEAFGRWTSGWKISFSLSNEVSKLLVWKAWGWARVTRRGCLRSALQSRVTAAV